MRTIDATSATPALLDRLLRDCVALDASDLHLVPGQPPYFRVHGVLEPRPDESPLRRGRSTGWPRS